MLGHGNHGSTSLPSKPIEGWQNRLWEVQLPPPTINTRTLKLLTITMYDYYIIFNTVGLILVHILFLYFCLLTTSQETNHLLSDEYNKYQIFMMESFEILNLL